MIYLYFIIIFIFSIYSYSLVDPNLTLINSPLWEYFRNYMVILGYHQRAISSIIYLVLVLIMFYFNFYFYKNYKKYNIIKLALFSGLVLIISYPFLSHDIFNYMFDAKILTFYHKNPYFYKALDFPKDSWLNFMHWTHRTYPYGPVFLPLTIIPSFLSFGKFILNFLFFKIFFFIFYYFSTYFLNKINKKYAIFFATNPLILIEGLVNCHNDLIAVFFGITGIYFLSRKYILSRILFLISAGIKYTTFPILFLTKKINSKINLVVLISIFLIILYMSFFIEIQPWYFLILFILFPYFKNNYYLINIFFAGLLFSYYPFIALGDWGMKSNIIIKHNIIIAFFVINFIFLFLYNFINIKKNAKT